MQVVGARDVFDVGREIALPERGGDAPEDAGQPLQIDVQAVDRLGDEGEYGQQCDITVQTLWKAKALPAGGMPAVASRCRRRSARERRRLARGTSRDQRGIK